MSERSSAGPCVFASTRGTLEQRLTAGRFARAWLVRCFALLLVSIACMHAASGWAQGLLDLPSLPLNGIGRVEAIAVQADGKIIIGGAFTYVDAAGDVRINIARFNANGTLDTTFNFKATSVVDALAIVGNTLYIGGDFTGFSLVGGASTLRNRLAAVDLGTLTITAWDPDADGEVFVLAASGTTLYAGGRFTFVSGTQRIGAAAFNTSAGGALNGWDPEPRDGGAPGPVFQSVIYALVPFGGSIYVGGTFTQIGGLSTPVARDNIAAVDPVNGLATSWDPVASNGGGTAIVRSIVPTASVVYLGGQFSGLNGVSSPFAQRLGIGAVSTSAGVATAFNPGVFTGFGTVRAMTLDGSTLYAGGEFTAIGGATRNHAAGLDTATPAITALTRVSSVATANVASTVGLANGNTITIVGASPSAYNGVQGPITIVDLTHFTFPIAGNPTTPATGSITYANNNDATAFNPNLDGDVHSMALTVPSTSLLLGGSFVRANNAANPAFGGFSKTSGATTIAGYVYDTAAVWSLVRHPNGKTIVAGDYFMNVGGVLYRSLARLNADDTLDTGWNPLVDGQVVTADLGPIILPATEPDTVLIGGTFANVGSTAKARLAAVNLTTGLATAFDANVNSAVNKVIVDGTTAYIGGRFTSVGSTSRNFVAAVNATTGALQSWYPSGGADDFVETLALDASNVYLGGSFFTVGGQTRFNVAKVAKASSIVDPWNPGTNEKVFGITWWGQHRLCLGQLQSASTVRCRAPVRVSATTGAVLPWNPNPDFIVLKVVPSPTAANTSTFAGAFINVGATQVGNAAAVDATTGAVKPWFPLMNDAVYDLLPDATRVMLSGVFVNSALVPRLSLAAFSNSGVPDPPTGVTATPGSSSVSVSFTPPVNDGGSAITGYTVTSTPGVGGGTRRPAARRPRISSQASRRTPRTPSGVVATQRHRIRARAFRAIERGAAQCGSRVHPRHALPADGYAQRGGSLGAKTGPQLFGQRLGAHRSSGRQSRRLRHPVRIRRPGADAHRGAADAGRQPHRVCGGNRLAVCELAQFPRRADHCQHDPRAHDTWHRRQLLALPQQRWPDAGRGRCRRLFLAVPGGRLRQDPTSAVDRRGRQRNRDGELRCRLRPCRRRLQRRHGECHYLARSQEHGQRSGLQLQRTQQLRIIRYGDDRYLVLSPGWPLIRRMK